MIGRPLRSSMVLVYCSLMLFVDRPQPTHAWTSISSGRPHSPSRSSSPRLVSLFSTKSDDRSEDYWDAEAMEVLQGDDYEEDLYGDDTPDDWVPDATKAQRQPKVTHLIPAKDVLGVEKNSKDDKEKDEPSKPSPYTEEEEELIDAMGGKQARNPRAPPSSSRRQDGFLGDCTLYEIAMDYSVPICYLADVLCLWGVPVPINIHDRLGDLVTGEQAFALVEAVNSLDVGALQDRYSNYNMMQLCAEWDMDLKEVFEFAMKEGWSLPFGVRTNLRVEQDDELLRVFSAIYRG